MLRFGLDWILRFQHYFVNISSSEDRISISFASLKPLSQAGSFEYYKPYFRQLSIFDFRRSPYFLEGLDLKLKSHLFIFFNSSLFYIYKGMEKNTQETSYDVKCHFHYVLLAKPGLGSALARLNGIGFKLC